jgi:hypothetical protein
VQQLRTIPAPCSPSGMGCRPEARWRSAGNLRTDKGRSISWARAVAWVSSSKLVSIPSNARRHLAVNDDVARTAAAELLTLGEAAAVLRTPVATLRYWRHLGVGPDGFRLGRRVLYRRQDVDRWVAEQRGPVTPSIDRSQCEPRAANRRPDGFPIRLFLCVRFTPAYSRPPAPGCQSRDLWTSGRPVDPELSDKWRRASPPHRSHTDTPRHAAEATCDSRHGGDQRLTSRG